MTEEQKVPPGGEPGGTRVRDRRRTLTIAAIAAGCVLLLGAGAGGYAYWRLDHNIEGVDIDRALGSDRPAPRAAVTAPVDEAPTGPLNLLVLGSDSRSGKDNAELGGGDAQGGARSDTAMIVHLNAAHTEATVVSIPRDTLVDRPSCPRKDGGRTYAAENAMFNSAYAVGGPVCAVKTVEKLTDVRMDHYVEVDFAGFADLVDAIGGVTVTTTEDIDDEKSRLRLDAGTHTLDGKQALAFARTRHGIGDESDLGRIALQQQLVKALVGQVRNTELLSDPVKLYSIADALTESLTTDTGLDSLGELRGLGSSLEGLAPEDVTTVLMPVVQAPWNRNRVIADEPEAKELWEALADDRPVPTPSGEASPSSTPSRPAVEPLPTTG